MLAVPSDHPVLDRRELRQAFLTAWKDVEDFEDEFRNDNFDGWPEEEEVAPVAAAPVAPVFAKPEAGLTPLELYDRWAPVASIQLEERNRGYVQRLQELLGKKPISQIEPDDLARFRAAALKFPNTKRPAVLALPPSIVWDAPCPIWWQRDCHPSDRTAVLISTRRRGRVCSASWGTYRPACPLLCRIICVRFT